MPTRVRVLFACLAASGLVAGCAHAPAVTSPAEPREKVIVTGSRLPQRVDTSSGRPATTSPVAIYTREELNRAGHGADLGAALRMLDPAAGR